MNVLPVEGTTVNEAVGALLTLTSNVVECVWSMVSMTSHLIVLVPGVRYWCWAVFVVL